MATIKSYTDINQSRKLAEILPLESDGCMTLRKGDKEITLTNSYEANDFLGIDRGFEHEPICESTGIKLFTAQGPSHWDDGVEMTPCEWAEVARVLVLGYS